MLLICGRGANTDCTDLADEDFLLNRLNLCEVVCEVVCGVGVGGCNRLH